MVEHDSGALGCPMRIAVFLPDNSENAPVLVYLSGLTCTEQNATQKSGLQRWCAKHKLILVCPDTSPRGEDIADSEDWDLGQGAGFYLSATELPWAEHYRMDRYVLDEVLTIANEYTSNRRRGITGHSMGGMGAIRLHLANPGFFHSVSAFAPILQPLDVPWGHKAFSAYLGDDREAWEAHDPATLIAMSTDSTPILIDQGSADGFLETQLLSERFLANASTSGHPVTYRLQPGYDHSYYFVATFAEDHVAHHAAALKV